MKDEIKLLQEVADSLTLLNDNYQKDMRSTKSAYANTPTGKIYLQGVSDGIEVSKERIYKFINELKNN